MDELSSAELFDVTIFFFNYDTKNLIVMLKARGLWPIVIGHVDRVPVRQERKKELGLTNAEKHLFIVTVISKCPTPKNEKGQLPVSS